MIIDSLITKPVLIGAGALVLALTAALGVQSLRVKSLQVDVATVTAEFAKYRSDAVQHAFDVQQEREADARTRDKEKDNAIKIAAAQTAAAESAARDANTVGQQLRSALAAARTRGCPINADPGPRLAGPAADPPTDLYADVQRRLDEAAEGIARYADASSIAGDVCRAQYASLKPKE